MQVLFPDVALSLATPEIGLAALICLVLIVDLFLRVEDKAATGMVSLVGTLILAGVSLSQWGEGVRTTFGGFYVADNFSTFVKVLVLLCAALSILLSLQYAKVEKFNYGEFYVMILFSVFGMLVLASANDLLAIFLGIETMSISVYVLVGFIRQDPLSREASLKYFLMGAFATGIVLYGMALLYGLTGTTGIAGIAKALSRNEALLSSPALALALILLVAGFGFKLALVPFHMWLPDAYTGAPTSITAFMSVAVKMAAFAALMRLFFVGLEAVATKWNLLLWLLAAFTMIWANVAAIAQTNLKRMLAYSSIAHAGYGLLGVVASLHVQGGEVSFTRLGISAVLFYMLVYMFTNLGAFGMLVYLCREDYRGDNIEDWRGVGQDHPWAALAFVVFLLSLAGIPPTGGFVGKLYVFAAAIDNGFYVLAVIGVLTSVVSLYYYGRVMMVMFMEPRGEAQPPVYFSKAPSLFFALIILVAGTLLLGIFPSSFLEAARGAVSGII